MPVEQHELAAAYLVTLHADSHGAAPQGNLHACVPEVNNLHGLTYVAAACRLQTFASKHPPLEGDKVWHKPAIPVRYQALFLRGLGLNDAEASLMMCACMMPECPAYPRRQSAHSQGNGNQLSGINHHVA